MIKKRTQYYRKAVIAYSWPLNSGYREDGKLLYNDDDHLNNYGAELVAKEFGKFLRSNP